MNKAAEINVQDFHENDRRLAGHAPYAPPVGNQYGMQVVTPGANATAHTVIVVGNEQPWVWTWCPTITAVVSFFLCPLAGFIATVMSLLSYTDHSSKRYNDARSKKSYAVCCGITGLILGGIAIILWIASIAILLNQSHDYRVNTGNNF